MYSCIYRNLNKLSYLNMPINVFGTLQTILRTKLINNVEENI